MPKLIRKLLIRLDLVTLSGSTCVRNSGQTGSKQNAKDLHQSVEDCRSPFATDNKPEWMVLDVIPVIPPDLRPSGSARFRQLCHQ